MSGDMLGEQDDASLSGQGNETTRKRYRRELVCYRDADGADAVCGDCGRPVCGPILNTTLKGLVSSVFNEHGHGRRFHDSTFHEYRSGLKRVGLVVVLLGTALLFSVVFPNLLQTVVSLASLTPIGLNQAVVHSSVLLAIAAILTLRYQRGERTTDFRIRVRRTTDRVFCDKCFENRLVQWSLTYALIAVSAIVILFGIREVFTRGSALPLRVVVLGVAIAMVRDDLVAYVMEVVGMTDRETADDTVVENETTADRPDEPDIEMDIDSSDGEISDD